MSNEYTQVEKPLIEQLQGLGWQFMEGHRSDPSRTLRDSFSDVIQQPLLRQQLYRINTRIVDSGEPEPWLDEGRISSAVSALTRLSNTRLMEANQAATELLLDGFVVEGVSDWDGGRARTIHYIDWEQPENNTFTVANQYRVKCPPGHDRGFQHIVPDLVLLVNGIVLTVIECKSPSIPEPMAEAIDQLRRYSNQRFVDHEVSEREGAPALFNTCQLMLATAGEQCLVGTVGARANHFLPWKTVASIRQPQRKETEVAAELGTATLSAQQRAVAGLLEPATLLDIIRHFTLFTTKGGQTIKLICRYQQYRGVVRTIDRLRNGKTLQQDGEYDRRGGIIWHTQGSGKSLTMVFMLRKLRTNRQLRRFKVVIVTDRTDLQKQLSETAVLSGDTPQLARNGKTLKNLLRQQGPGLVFAMIQKYRDQDSKRKATEKAATFETLNSSEDILVLVDEAHRTQAGDLHANLLAGLPNCARIGFTGTPIIMGEKKRTHEIFGEFIDKYTIRESEADGATVPVLYEGRTALSVVKDGSNLDALFEDFFAERSAEELEAIREKYATRGSVMEAWQLIQAKAEDMLRHYVTHILPNGLKAQLVAYSRRAAVRYLEALEEARKRLLADADALSPSEKAMNDDALCRRSPRLQALVQTWRYRDTVRKLEFATVISATGSDDASWKAHTERTSQDTAIERFKKPLLEKEGEKSDPLAFLIVKSMLLTGFDAPIEGVMYLDRAVREAELLQTIARVNRTGYHKSAGIVVDYYGVANHLKEALKAYSDDDIDGGFRSLKEEIPILKDRHLRAMDMLRARGIGDLNDIEGSIQALNSERARQEFAVKLKAFFASLELILPRPEALPYTDDARQLAMIQDAARRRYRDSIVLGRDIGAKVRKLIDDHIISLGVKPKVAPINLTDKSFASHIEQVKEGAGSYNTAPEVASKAVASEMEHAVRSHITQKLDEDPIYYRKLSERLEQILLSLEGQWEQIAAALQQIINEESEGSATRQEEGLPDMAEHAVPFYRMLCAARDDGEQFDLISQSALVELTETLVAHIATEVKTVDFWESHGLQMQEALEEALFEYILESELIEIDRITPLVDKLRELAKANSYRLEQQ